MATIFFGRPLANQIIDQLRVQILELSGQRLVPQLAIILVGQNPASANYTALKQKQAEFLGIKVIIKQLPLTVAEEQLLALIKSINQDPMIHGIVVQMPLPDWINREKVAWSISAKKDVDGFQMRDFLPPAPLAIIELLKYYGISVTRKRVAIIGRGFLIGRPLATLLTRFGARVSLIDEQTRFLARRTQEAEMIVSATGRANIVTKDLVREGQIVVDAGGEWTGKSKVKSQKLKVEQEDLKFVGEVAREEIEPVVEALVPNPGGIGPVTVALLLRNVVQAAKRSLVR